MWQVSEKGTGSWLHEVCSQRRSTHEHRRCQQAAWGSIPVAAPQKRWTTEHKVYDQEHLPCSYQCEMLGRLLLCHLHLHISWMPCQTRAAYKGHNVRHLLVMGCSVQ